MNFGKHPCSSGRSRSLMTPVKTDQPRRQGMDHKIDRLMPILKSRMLQVLHHMRRHPENGRSVHAEPGCGKKSILRRQEIGLYACPLEHATCVIGPGPYVDQFSRIFSILQDTRCSSTRMAVRRCEKAPPYRPPAWYRGCFSSWRSEKSPRGHKAKPGTYKDLVITEVDVLVLSPGTSSV